MTEKLLDGIWKQMQLSKGLEESEKDIYIFGVYQGAILLLNICTSLIIGVILNMVLEIIVYLVCFIPLRIFAGGYHAKTQFRCYIMSSFTTVIILLGIGFLQEKDSVWELICFVISLGIIWRFAPVADANKPLLCDEQVSYQKNVRRILILLAGIAGLSYFMGGQMITAVIEVSVCFLSVILIMGLYKNKKHMKNDEMELL